MKHLFCLPAFLICLAMSGQTFSPVGTSGYNLDAIAENTLVTSTTGGAIDGSNYVMYSAAYGALYSVSNGLPNNGVIASGTRTYQLQSYTLSNVLYLTTATSGTLLLNTPAAFAGVSILGFATEGNVSFDVTLRFTDNSTATYANQSMLDWFGAGSPVLSGFDRVSRATGVPAQTAGNPKLYALDLPLICPDRSKNLAEIVFQNISTGPRLVVLAVSGTGAPSYSVDTSPVTCIGGTNGTASISATGGIPPFTYTWNTTPVQSVAGISGLPLGSVSYSVQDNGGCIYSGIAVITQTIVPEPSLLLSSNAYTVCSGATFTMGVSGASTYSWVGGGNSSIYSPPPVTVSTQSTVAYTVNGTSSYNCPRTGTLAIVVNPLPAVAFTGSISPLCNNSAPVGLVAIIQPTGGSFSGTGVGSNSFIPTNSGVGTFTITYTRTDQNNCSNTASLAVQVNSLAPPQIATMAPLCSNAPAAQLTVNPIGGNFGGNGLSPAGIFSPSVAGPGNHLISYTVTVGPCTSASSRSITVFASPTPSFASPKTFFCKTSNSLFFNANPAGGTFSGPGMTGATFNPNSAGVGTHTISYTYADGNGCTGLANITVTVSTCTGLEEQTSAGMTLIYPNPSSGRIHVICPAKARVTIYSTSGALIDDVYGHDNYLLELSPGVYFLRSEAEGTVATDKIVILE